MIIILIVILVGLGYWAAISSKKPGRLKILRREVCTYNNVKKGILSVSAIRWCIMPISAKSNEGRIPDGMLDITHPSVVVLPKPWNGYNVWLAATPYPQKLGNAAQIYENTSIFFANTSHSSMPIVFKAIKENPIISRDGAAYNSDPDLLFENSVMYVVTRKCNATNYSERIVLQKSTDGQNWSNPVTLFDLPNNCKRWILSPCILKIGNVYRIYMFNVHFDPRYSWRIGGVITENIEIWEGTSLEYSNFHFVKSVKWNNPENVWHGDMVYYRGKYYLLYCGTNYNYKILGGFTIDTFKYLWLAVSEDGYNFKAYSKPILQRSGIYRPTFMIDDKGTMNVYFATENSYWGKDHKKYPGGNRIGTFSVKLDYLIKQELR